MPEYLAPGVFIEETSFRHKAIEGVGTTATSIVGPTRTGPLRGLPEPVTSFREFERIYGDAEDLVFQGTKIPNYTALAARSFFENGGKQLFVSRTVREVNKSDVSGDNSSAARASSSTGKDVVFRSRFPGSMGNYTLEFRWRDTVNVLAGEAATKPAADEILLLQASNVPKEALTDNHVPDDKFPLRLKMLVKAAQGGTFSFERGEATDKEGSAVTKENLGKALDPAKLPSPPSLERPALKPPPTGKLAVGEAVELKLPKPADISHFSGVEHWGDLTALRGTLQPSAAGGADVSLLRLSKDLNTGLSADLDVPLSALAALPPGSALMVRRNFDLDVRKDDAKNLGEIVYSRTDLTAAKGQRNSLDKVFPARPEKRQDQLEQPISCQLGEGEVASALHLLFERGPIDKPDPILGARYLIKLAHGTDGELPVAADYAGEVDEVKGSTGLAALEGIEDIAMVMAPASAAQADSHLAVVMEIQKHCLKMRYRMGIIESREGMSLQEVREFRSNLNDSRLALYHPWVVVSDPTGDKDVVTVPPSGFIAGIYVRNDVNRGVHKAPANEVLTGALRLEQQINKFQQELLNPDGINCLRSFPMRGHLVWGGRTLSGDPEWKYVNIRRYFNYLERSIEKATQWAVFEPNCDSLWDNIRSSVEDFLFNEFKSGRLLGCTPKDAYFVRCDRSTMTQNDIDNGRMICLVGVAAITPAEFVIFRIGQWTADAK